MQVGFELVRSPDDVGRFAALMVLHQLLRRTPMLSEVLLIAGKRHRLEQASLTVEVIETAWMVQLLVDPLDLFRVRGISVSRRVLDHEAVLSVDRLVAQILVSV